MEDQGVDSMTDTMEKGSVSMETSSDLAVPKPNKLCLKLKISSKSLKRCGQHVCPVCSKEFTSGKALGGHIRIHMSSKNGRHRKFSKLNPRNIHRAKNKKRISKVASSPKGTADGAADDDLPLNNQEGNEVVSCCVCNKEFRSKKSLFGHMRNHPERGWRGIRPPPSDKNSCCSSVSENEQALEVDQMSCATPKGSVTAGADLLKSLPKWSNTSKRCGKFTPDDNEIPEAANCLMMLARGRGSFDLGQSSGRYQKNKLNIDKTRSWGSAKEVKKRIGIEIGEGKGKGKGKGKVELKTESHQVLERKRGDFFKSDEKPKEAEELLAEELDVDMKTMVRENKMKVNYADAKMIENNCWFDQFQKFPVKPDEVDDPSAKGRYKGKGKVFPSSQTPAFYPGNPSGALLKAPSIIETASPAEGKHLLIRKTAGKAAEGSQVCAPKMRDFDLNEPYVSPDDGEAAGT